VGVGGQKIKAYPNKKLCGANSTLQTVLTFSAHASLSVFFAKIINSVQLIIVYIEKKPKQLNS